MFRVSHTFDQLEAQLRNAEESIPVVIDEACSAGADRAVDELRADTVVGETGRLRDGWERRREDEGSYVVENVVDYAQFHDFDLEGVAARQAEETAHEIEAGVARLLE
jgi:allantoicase